MAKVRPRFLIIRHPTFRRFFFEVLPRWLEANLPQLMPYFDVQDLPITVRDWSQYAAHIPWLQDPVQRWSRRTYQQAQSLARQCDRRGIPVINRVDRLLNATKSRGAQLLNELGIQTARMAPIRDREEFVRTLSGLKLPLFVREDWGHSRRMVRIDRPEDAAAIPWRRFERPLAVEVVDICDPRDGLYRKYRYFAAGDLGITHHLQISHDWITRGENRVVSPEAQREELDYVGNPDPNHAVLQRARRAMGLDIAAFDYGYTPDGRMVVWEANPFPHIKFSTKAFRYRNAAIHRTMLAMVHLYFAAAGLQIPRAVEQGLAADFAAIERQFQPPRPTTFKDRVLALPKYLPRWAA